jgi:hypothetical protein
MQCTFLHHLFHGEQISWFGFILQYGPPGIYQPGQITDRAVLNVYGGLSEWRADGYLLDKYQVRILKFYN